MKPERRAKLDKIKRKVAAREVERPASPLTTAIATVVVVSLVLFGVLCVMIAFVGWPKP